MVPITIEHDDYEKISDELMWLGSSVVLSFNVILNKYMSDGRRNNYHKEIQYGSNRANANVINIKRSFTFNLSLTDIKDKNIFIMIGINDILSFRALLETAFEWFTEKRYSNLFVKKDNKIIMLGRVDSMKITNLPQSKYLEIEPIVGIYPNGEEYIGARLYLSSVSNFVDLDFSRLMGLKYLVDSLNMYESAQMMINYLQRPEYGTNLITYCTLEEQERNSYEGKFENNRSVNGKASFFDKMKGLEG